MKQFFRDNALYLSAFLLVLLGMVTALICIPKPELHLLLNGYHTPALDSFFFHYTHFINWPVYVLMLLPLIVWKQGWTAVFAVTEGASALVIQIIKHIFNMPRPKTFFTELGLTDSDLFADFEQIIVPQVHMHSWHSFPSGHTATFFVFFSLCAFIYAHEHFPAKSLVAVLCLVLALLGGYSRIYLSQHFLFDVCVGMTEGTLMSVFVFCLFEAKGWTTKPWFDGNLLALCKKKKVQ